MTWITTPGRNRLSASRMRPARMPSRWVPPVDVRLLLSGDAGAGAPAVAAGGVPRNGAGLDPLVGAAGPRPPRPVLWQPAWVRQRATTAARRMRTAWTSIMGREGGQLGHRDVC